MMQSSMSNAAIAYADDKTYLGYAASVKRKDDQLGI